MKSVNFKTDALYQNSCQISTKSSLILILYFKYNTILKTYMKPIKFEPLYDSLVYPEITMPLTILVINHSWIQ